jgi:hypothetical protein
VKNAGLQLDSLSPFISLPNTARQFPGPRPWRDKPYSPPDFYFFTSASSVGR